MPFEEALKCLKNGRSMMREGWNGKGMWISLQKPDANSKMTQPYIYMKTVDGGKVPWTPSQTDLMANDWQFAYWFERSLLLWR